MEAAPRTSLNVSKLASGRQRRRVSSHNIPANGQATIVITNAAAISSAPVTTFPRLSEGGGNRRRSGMGVAPPAAGEPVRNWDHMGRCNSSQCCASKGSYRHCQGKN
jgi:hypothetical protein